MYLYLILAVMFVAVAVGAGLAAANAGRRRTFRRLMTIVDYGFAPEPDTSAYLEPQPQRSGVAGLATWLGNLASRRLGAMGVEESRELLISAGMYTLSPGTLLGYRMLATVGLPLVALVLFGASSFLRVVVVLFALFAGWVLPLTIVQRRARKRLDQIDRRLPDLIDLLCVMVEAGLSFAQAVRIAADQFQPPLGDELRLTLQEQTMGLGVDEALGNMAKRADTPAVRAFVRAMSQGERMGISTGQIMRNLSHEMRQRRRSQAEERAQKTPVLMLFPLVFLIFPAMLIILMTPAVISMVHSFHGA